MPPKKKVLHQGRKRHHGRKCHIKVENAIHQVRKWNTVTGRKCSIKIENVIKLENVASMCIIQCKQKINEVIKKDLNVA